MKPNFFLIVLFFLICSFSQAQQKDYTLFLDTLFLNAKNDFKDIAGEENQTSIFRESKLKPEIGEIKISMMSFGAILNWTIPLSQAEKLKKEVEDFIKIKFSNNKIYEVANSDDLEDEDFQTKNIYLKNGDKKPKILFQTLCFKDKNNPMKSNFTMIIYGEK